MCLHLSLSFIRMDWSGEVELVVVGRPVTPGVKQTHHKGSQTCAIR